MDSKDIEAQLKSLIGLNLSQNTTGTLPISKGTVLNFHLNLVLYKDHCRLWQQQSTWRLSPRGRPGRGRGLGSG